ncbi:MAG TPA: terminase family protein [Methylomirabilota bacterium]|nr:terminase family protein [Methylomirabilota bacterium]
MPSRLAVLEALPLAAVSLRSRVVEAVRPDRWMPEPYQIPPPEDADWLYWLFIAGRGTGKTGTGAHFVDEYASRHPGHRIGILAPTYGDARDLCVEGETGLLRINPTIAFNRSLGELRWSNGSQARLFGTFTPEDVERLRGPQHHLIWWDEFCASRQLREAWDMMRFGLRLGARPRAVITSTPKPRPKLVELLADPMSIVALTADGRRPSTADNPHLHPDVRAKLYETYGGTGLGRQELMAEIMSDVEGALWTRELLERNRVPAPPQMVRIVVAIDPSGSTEDGSEVGIVAAGKGTDGQAYVLRDASERLSPERWARRAVQLYHELRADRILAEKNFGGDMVRATIQSVDRNIPVKLVVASRGKKARAEPVAALDEQGRVHHVGAFPTLEDQLCSWVPESGDPSPDRLDARVWAITELMLGPDTVRFY